MFWEVRARSILMFQQKLLRALGRTRPGNRRVAPALATLLKTESISRTTATLYVLNY